MSYRFDSNGSLLTSFQLQPRPDGLVRSSRLDLGRSRLVFESLAGRGVEDPLHASAGQLPAFDIRFDNGSMVDVIGGITPTFTRPSSVKNVWNGSSFVEVAADVPGFQVDPVTGRRGYLHEPAATNQWTQSADLMNAVWTREAGATYANTAEVLVTGASVMRLTEASNSSTKGFSRALSVTAGATITASIFVKKETTTADSLRLNFGSGSGQFASPTQASVNLTTGAIGSAINCTVATQVLAGGWLRISVTATPLLTAVAAITHLLEKSGIAAYAGDGVGTASVTCPQLETGPVATSPIITTGSAVTRAADTMTVSGANFSSWYNQLGGVVYVDWTLPPAALSNYFAFSINNGSFSNEFGHYVNSVITRNEQIVNSASVSQAPAQLLSGATLGANQRIACRLVANDAIFARNGALSGANTSFSMPLGVSQITIGSRNSTFIQNGPIYRLAYFPPGPAQSRIQQMTA